MKIVEIGWQSGPIINKSSSPAVGAALKLIYWMDKAFTDERIIEWKNIQEVGSGFSQITGHPSGDRGIHLCDVTDTCRVMMSGNFGLKTEDKIWLMPSGIAHYAGEHGLSLGSDFLGDLSNLGQCPDDFEVHYTWLKSIYQSLKSPQPGDTKPFGSQYR